MIVNNNEVGRQILTQCIVEKRYSRKKIFPNSVTNVAIEIIRMLYTGYLCPSDVAKMMSISWSWYFLIIDDIHFYGSKIFVHGCISEAKKAAFKIKDSFTQDIAYRDIVKFEVGHNPFQAEKCAQKIQNLLLKVEALLEIAKVDLQHDFALAKRIARNIEDIYEMSYAWFDIVQNEIYFNLPDALQTVLNIYDSFLLALAYVEFAKVNPIHNLENLKHNIEFNLEAHHLSLVLVEIIKVEAYSNLNQAKETLKLIEHKYQSYGYLEIVKVEARSNLVEAKQYIRDQYNNFDSDVQDAALCEIVKIEVCLSLTQARETTKGIKSAEFQAEAFIEIAKADLFHDLTQAFMSTQRIKNDNIRSSAYFKLAEVAAQYNINLVDQFQKLEVQDCLLRALILIVSAKAKEDLEQSKKILVNIKNPFNRVEALIMIAKIVLLKKY